MTLLKAFLQKPSTQRILNRKPGEKGFSLIELVVVVAVLAILAAIAVPNFTGMNEKAANAAAQANLKGAYKECAFKIAKGEAAGTATYEEPVDDGYYSYSTTSAGKCDAVLKATLTSSHSDYDSTDVQWIAIEVKSGDKTKNGTITDVNW